MRILSKFLYSKKGKCINDTNALNQEDLKIFGMALRNLLVVGILVEAPATRKDYESYFSIT